MRVSKTVKEYIEKEVRNKIYEKYAFEKETKEKQLDFLKEVRETAQQEAFKAYIQTVKEMIKDYVYIEIDENIEKKFYISGYNNIRIKDSAYTNNIHNWESRANKEIKEKVEEIIVTLELGGNKKDLDRMLKEI